MVQTDNKTTGKVSGIVSSLISVEVDGPVQQNEICYIHTGEEKLMAEVIKVMNKEVYIQVFENTRGVRVNDKVVFDSHMLEATLAPGLLQKNYDGLQNNLDTMEGVFLKRGQYTDPLDREKKFDFTRYGFNFHPHNIIGYRCCS